LANLGLFHHFSSLKSTFAPERPFFKESAFVHARIPIYELINGIDQSVPLSTTLGRKNKRRKMRLAKTAKILGLKAVLACPPS
jgi:hypothetical protein